MIPGADEGVVTCANRGLLQKMLSNVMDEEEEVDADDDEDADSGERDGQLGMSLRNVTSHPQPRGKVPTITSPPSGRPGSRGGPGGVRRMSLESQGRPLSRGERSTPSSSRVTVTTGAPRPALAAYVSQPRPGSRGGFMPTAEVITSPGRAKAAVGTAQPKSKSAAPKAAGYAGLHQARVSPSSAASATKHLVPAAKPRCGPSAFDLVKKLNQAEDPEEDDGNFIMPPGSDEEDEEQVALNALDAALHPEQEDSAADYVARVKRDLGLAEDMSAESFAPVTPQVTAFPAQARARSTDTRTEAAPIAQRALGALPRSRSSDPRAHVVAARAYKSQDSDEEDDDDVEQRKSFQWKADVRSLVKNFAEEERARAASPKPKAMSSPATRDARAKPPRAPIAVGDRQAGDEDTIASSNKKARAPVEYTPATLEEYKQRFGGKADYSELGRLGPDLDDEDLLMKRAIQEKVKEFSRELHRVNKHRAAKAQPKHEPKADPKPTARAKAMQFAKNIPKPKLLPPKQVLVTPTKPLEEDQARQEAVEWEDLRRRERQHLEDVARIAEVKQLLERLAV